MQALPNSNCFLQILLGGWDKQKRMCDIATRVFSGRSISGGTVRPCDPGSIRRRTHSAGGSRTYASTEPLLAFLRDIVLARAHWGKCVATAAVRRAHGDVELEGEWRRWRWTWPTGRCSAWRRRSGSPGPGNDSLIIHLARQSGRYQPNTSLCC